MYNTKDWNYENVNFIEFYGLRRSGNHAVIAWLMKNLNTSEDQNLEKLIAPMPEIGFISKKCGDVYHLNDVGSGWSTGNPNYLAGLIDAYVSEGAKTIIISYEDYDPTSSLVLAFPDQFNFLKKSKKIALVRDIPNLLSSRYKASIGPHKDSITFEMNINKINSWISSVKYKGLVIRYEDWLCHKEYRDNICFKLNISNKDYTHEVSSAGGGSSFNNETTLDKNKLLNRYSEIDLPKDWRFYLEAVEVIRARRFSGYLKYKKDAKLIKVIGDSHTSIFDGYVGDDYIFDQTRCHGSTARGSINPNTKTNSLAIFKKGLKGKKGEKIIVQLGEVDCGYLIWYKNKHTGESIELATKKSIDNLFNFIKTEIRPIYEPNEIIVMGVIPPIIEDNTSPNFLKGKRADADVTLNQRLNLTNTWNKEVLKRCSDLGYLYLDINSEISNKHGKVLEQYKNPDIWNHHLWEYSTIQVVLQKLKKLI